MTVLWFISVLHGPYDPLVVQGVTADAKVSTNSIGGGGGFLIDTRNS